MQEWNARKPGSLYQVRINANPDDFLDWDKPLSEQSERVRKALSAKMKETGDANVGKWDAPAFYNYLAEIADPDHMAQLGATFGPSPATKGEAKASSILREDGIPGIKYLDAGSRGAGDGTRNYVVFDDKMVEILKKYGWVPGMAIPAAAMMEYQQQGGSAPQM